MAAIIGRERARRDDPPPLPKGGVVAWIPMWNEYGVPVAGPSRGNPYQLRMAAFCPWCGSALPPSKRHMWFDRLNGLGFEDPGSDDIPEEYHSDAWWRRA